MQLQTFDTAAIENQAMRAYFRRLGKLADQPSQFCTEFFELDGEQYVRLANINRNLATYRVIPRSDGWWLRYVDIDLNGSNWECDGAMDGGCGSADMEHEIGAGSDRPFDGASSLWWSILADLPTVGQMPADIIGASD
jgi:hypothetical protein